MREYAGDTGLVRGKILKRFKQIKSATALCTFIAVSVQRPPQPEPLSIKRASSLPPPLPPPPAAGHAA